jgi:hypothetical protein
LWSVLDLSASEGIDIVLTGVCLGVDVHVSVRGDDVAAAGEGGILRA